MLSPSYNTLHGTENFNSDPTDDVTARLSKLTAMMADRVQDRGITLRGTTILKNTTNGAGQDITATATITIDKPKSASQVVTLGCSLPVNSVGVVDISREGSGALTVIVENLNSSLLLSENKLIIFYRLGDNKVYNWEGQVIPKGGFLTYGANETISSKTISFFYPAQVSLDLTTDSFLFEDTAVNATVLINSSTNNNVIDTASVMSTGITILDGQSMWVRIDRTAAKTFDTVAYADAEDTTIHGKVFITGRASVPVEQDVLVLYERLGNALLGEKQKEVFQGNIYEEEMILPLDVTAGSLITIPNDSRDSGNPQYYYLGAGQLQLWHNGARMNVGASSDWEEVVGSVIPTLSNQIRIQKDLYAGETLTFRIDNNSGIYFANNSNVSLTMQQTYDTGRFILINSGQPVQIDGPVGEKLIQINGDMGVTGVVDPTAITFIPQITSPILAATSGLYVDTSHNLMFQKGGSTTTDLVNDLVRRDGTLAMTGNLDMNSHRITSLPIPLADGEASRKGYVDSQDASVLSTAEGYADSQDAINLATAEGYADSQDAINLATAEGYADSQDAINLATAEGYADTVASGAASSSLDLAGTHAMTGDINANSHTVKNLKTPTNSDEAAPKGYVDSKDRYTGLYKKATNGSGSPIAVGSVVRLISTGASTIDLANAASFSTVEGLIGIAAETIASGSDGYIQIAGEVTILTESGDLTIGNRTYISTSMAGRVTNTIPTSAGFIVYSLGVASDTNRIVLNPNLDAINENIYEETFSPLATVSAGTPISLPLDSRAGDSIQYYTVGECLLEVFFNGVKMDIGVSADYQEVGIVGTTSSTILFNRDLYPGEKLDFRINIRNSAYFISGGVGSATLQSAYNSGQSISIVTGQPVTITGTSGKLLHVAGDMQVDGVVDPTALQLTPQGVSPLAAGQAGIWVDTAVGSINYQSPAGSNLALDKGSFLLAHNASPVTIIKGAPVSVNPSGDIIPVDVSDEDSAFSVVGIAAADINSGETGNVITAGTLPTISGPFTLGRVLYASKSGNSLTDQKPSIGVAGFAANDFVIKIGVLVKDTDVPTNHNLVVNIQVIGTL